MKIPQGRTREQSRAAAASAPAGKSLTSPESKHAGLTEDKHADAEKLMLNLTDVKRMCAILLGVDVKGMCGSQLDLTINGKGDRGLEFVEVRHHPHYNDMATPPIYPLLPAQFKLGDQKFAILVYEGGGQVRWSIAVHA